MKTTKIFFLLALIAVFFSCQKEADVKLPKVEPKLVVACFISPQDTIIRAIITKSKPVFGEDTSRFWNDVVPNATVIIAEGGNAAQLLYDDTFQFYSVSASQFPIIAGKSYSLTVNTPDGKLVNASTTVPLRANNSITVSWKTSITKDDATQIEFSGNWQDFPNEKNFYRAAFMQTDEYYEYAWNGTTTVITDTLYNYYDIGRILKDDKDADGQLLDYSFKYEFWDSTKDSIKVSVFLLTITEEYYLYHRSPSYETEDFFSEPTLTYTNINGGLGVFAGYNTYKTTVTVPL